MRAPGSKGAEPTFSGPAVEWGFLKNITSGLSHLGGCLCSLLGGSRKILCCKHWMVSGSVSSQDAFPVSLSGNARFSPSPEGGGTGPE